MEKKNKEIMNITRIARFMMLRTPMNITNFEGSNIRRHYDEKTETWYFSVVDIVRALTEQTDFQLARNYWNQLKKRLKQEGNQSVKYRNNLYFV